MKIKYMDGLDKTEKLLFTGFLLLPLAIITQSFIPPIIGCAIMVLSLFTFENKKGDD